jgi:hypothetical protein
VSDETIGYLGRRPRLLQSGQDLVERIAESDPREPIKLSDMESDLIQLAADQAVAKRPPSHVLEELHSLRNLRS